MKTHSKSSGKGLVTCFIQAGLILFSILLIGYLLESQFFSFLFLFLSGWLLWTFVEYAIHRFLMHELITPGEKSDILNHQNHHQHPHDLRVKPIHRVAVSFLGIGVFTFSIYLGGSSPILGGFMIGFMIYNQLHYLLHQPYGKYFLPKIQEAHILHHTRYPHCGYSFSTILWDWLFDTLPPKNAEITEKMKENFFGKPDLKEKKITGTN